MGEQQAVEPPARQSEPTLQLHDDDGEEYCGRGRKNMRTTDATQSRRPLVVGNATQQPKYEARGQILSNHETRTPINVP